MPRRDYDDEGRPRRGLPVRTLRQLDEDVRRLDRDVASVKARTNLLIALVLGSGLLNFFHGG